MTFLSLHNKPEPRPSRKRWSDSGCCVAIFLLPDPAPHIENRKTVCMGYTAMTPQGRAGKRRRKGAGKPCGENGAPNINWSKWPVDVVNAKKSRLCKPCAEKPLIRANVQTVCRKCAATFLHKERTPNLTI